MKVRPYDRSTLWRSAFAKVQDDPDERDREALANAYQQLRSRAGDLVNEIHRALPDLTVHDLNHSDTLWDVASEICGGEYKLNPLEGFVLGASFLLHDAGMALAAYPGGLKELEESVEWRDAVVSIWKKQGIEDPSDLQRADPNAEVRSEAIFQVLRARHASQAKTLATAVWKHPTTGVPLALVQNDDLLESYGELIGNISASHHWPLPEVARFFGDPTPASAAWPREWKVNSLLLACILRCADACAIDETRAPSFLFAIRKPIGHSKRHWAFQNKIYPARRREDGLVFESKSPFRASESEDWWVCFDAIDVADRELRDSDALLTDRYCNPFAVRRIVGASDPEVLVKTVRVEGWKPVNTQPKISDPQSVIERLGGKQLYGNNPMVPIRELIQNSVDAIRARRFLDLRFCPSGCDRFPGQILLEITHGEAGEYWIAVEDNGIGMSERTITRSLLDFGNSFWSSPAAAELYPGLPSEKGFRPVGRFGIGFFSIFMYSDVAKVMSREFKGARDAWNVLSFEHGVRGRGNFSVETTPEEIRYADANTRIRIRVDDEFLWLLAKMNPMSAKTDEEKTKVFERAIISKVRDLVCALDVRVKLRFLNEPLMDLNDPLIYEKDLEAIWNFVFRESLFKEKNQKKMLAPMGHPPNPCYGFCGLNISDAFHSTMKSVGGFVMREPYGRMESIVGIAEYKITSANREPEDLAAPRDVIDDWVKDQIARVLREPLSDFEREDAARNLGLMFGDMRPLFFTRTSVGCLNLDEMIAALKDAKVAVFPVNVYRSEGVDEYNFSLPRIANEFQLSVPDIEFARFTVCPKWSTLSAIRKDASGLILNDVISGTYKDVWSTIINTLREAKIEFALNFQKGATIGKYIGLDSLRHDLKTGDDVVSNVIRISF
jgi:hypothetical protein